MRSEVEIIDALVESKERRCKATVERVVSSEVDSTLTGGIIRTSIAEHCNLISLLGVHCAITDACADNYPVHPTSVNGSRGIAARRCY